MFRRALADTLRAAGGLPGVAFLILSGAASTGYVWITKGAALVSWDSLIAGALGAGCAAWLLFVFNFVAAPSRIERERRLKAESELVEVLAQKSTLEQRPVFTLKLDNVGINGSPTNGEYPVLAIVAARNVGNRPSALELWGMEILTVEGELLSTTIFHVAGTFRGISETGHSIALAEDDAIYLKSAAAPIQNGAIIRGFIVCSSNNPRVGALVAGDTIRVHCSDVYGQKWQAEWTVLAGVSQEPAYYPGMNWRAGRNESNGHA